MGNMFFGLCCAILLAAAVEDAPTLLTAKEHPWGSFLPKSWCIVQTATVSKIDGRPVQSKQTVRKVLDSVDASGITLQETETLEVGGRVIRKQPQTVKYDFFQERIQENVQITQGPPAKISMTDKKVVPNCSVRIYKQQTPSGHLTTTVWYSPQVYPYVLRVEEILRSAPDAENPEGRIIRSVVSHVQETSALKNLRGSRRPRTYSLRTEEKVGNITRITDARCSWDVPGGLIESTTKEFDAQKKEISHSISRMTNYYSYELVPAPTPRNRAWVPVEVTN